MKIYDQIVYKILKNEIFLKKFYVRRSLFHRLYSVSILVIKTIVRTESKSTFRIILKNP